MLWYHYVNDAVNIVSQHFPIYPSQMPRIQMFCFRVQCVCMKKDRDEYISMGSLKYCIVLSTFHELGMKCLVGNFSLHFYSFHNHWKHHCGVFFVMGPTFFFFYCRNLSSRYRGSTLYPQWSVDSGTKKIIL